jgi:hypothetical protein
MTHRLRIGWGTLIVVGLGVALAAVVWSVHAGRYLACTVTFHDAKGLGVGDAVEMSGVRVGQVQEVKLLNAGPNPRVEVRVRVVPDYAGQIHPNATAVIRSADGANGARRKLEIVPGLSDKPAAPMPRKAVIEGRENPLDLSGWKIAQRMGGNRAEWTEKFRDWARSIQEMPQEARELTKDPRFRKAVDHFSEFMNRLADESGRLAHEKGGVVTEQAREARRRLADEWLRVRVELEPVLENFRQHGGGAVVDRIHAIFEMTEAEIEQLRQVGALRTVPTPLPPTPSTTSTQPATTGSQPAGI